MGLCKPILIGEFVRHIGGKQRLVQTPFRRLPKSRVFAAQKPPKKKAGPHIWLAEYFGLAPSRLKTNLLRTILLECIGRFSDDKQMFETMYKDQFARAFSAEAILLLDDLQFHIETHFPKETHNRAVFEMIDQVGSLIGSSEEGFFDLAVKSLFRFVDSVGIAFTTHLWQTLPKQNFYDLIARSCSADDFHFYQNVFRLLSVDTLDDVIKHPKKDYFEYDLQSLPGAKPEDDTRGRTPFENLDALAEGFKSSEKVWGSLQAWAVTMDVCHLALGPLHLLQENVIATIFKNYRAQAAGPRTISEGFFSGVDVAIARNFCRRYPIAYFFMANPQFHPTPTIESHIASCIANIVKGGDVDSPQDRMNMATLQLQALEGFYVFLTEHHPTVALQAKEHFDRAVLKVVEILQDNLSMAWPDFLPILQPALRRWFLDRPCALQSEQNKAQMVRLYLIDPTLCQSLWTQAPALRPNVDSACEVLLLAQSNRLVSSFSSGHSFSMKSIFPWKEN